MVGTSSKRFDSLNQVIVSSMTALTYKKYRLEVEKLILCVWGCVCFAGENKPNARL